MIWARCAWCRAAVIPLPARSLSRSITSTGRLPSIRRPRLYRVEPAKVRERIAREVEFDPDLWVLSLDLRGDDIGIDLAK